MTYHIMTNHIIASLLSILAVLTLTAIIQLPEEHVTTPAPLIIIFHGGSR